MEAEWANILVVARWLHKMRDGERIVSLFQAIREFLHICGYWEQRVSLAKQSLELIEKDGGEKQRCWLQSDLGWTLSLQDRFSEAHDCLSSALIVARQSGDIELLHYVYSAFTLLGERSRDYPLLWKYLPLWRELIPAIAESRKRKRRLVEITYRQATAEYTQGHLDTAEDLFRQMLDLAREIRWERAIAYALNYLGEIAVRRGDLQMANSLLEEGWQRIQQWADKRRMAYFERSFALLAEAEGDLQLALTHARRAHDLFHRLGMRQEEEETATLIERLEEALAQEMGTRGNLHSDPG